MAFLAQRYNTRRAGDEDEAGNGKLTGVWYARRPSGDGLARTYWADTPFRTCRHCETNRIPIEDAPTLIKEYDLTKFAADLVRLPTVTTAALSASKGTTRSGQANTPSLFCTGLDVPL